MSCQGERIFESHKRISMTFPSSENPDWGYARTKRCVLMTPSAEWVQSVYSCQFQLNNKTYIVPNRDYPYEGLMVYQDGENWKFIDCIALAIQKDDNNFIPLSSLSEITVRVNPWVATYCYTVPKSLFHGNEDRDQHLYVSYYLNSCNSPELVTGCVEVYFPDGHQIQLDNPIRLILQPFLDIRHMYTAGSDFWNYRVQIDQNSPGNMKIQISAYNRTLTFYLDEAGFTLFSQPEILNWWYKLGTGTRTESFNHQHQQNETIFIGENKNVAAFFNIYVTLPFPRNYMRFYYSCSLNSSKRNYNIPDIVSMFESSRKEDCEQLRLIQSSFQFSESSNISDAILARIVGLTKFKTFIELSKTNKFVQVPHAGAWWFRTPWYRDVFEGILSSFETMMKLPKERANVREIIFLALSEIESSSGRILNRIPEFKNLERQYNNSDATLLCFVIANAYFNRTKDVDFALGIFKYLVKTVRCFGESNRSNFEHSRIDGPPWVDDDTGLLLSVPHHSWIDTRSQYVEIGQDKLSGLPNRASQQFIRDLYNHIDDKNSFGAIMSSSVFFLPEINAQWIIMLRGAIGLVDWLITNCANNKNDFDTFEGARNNISTILSKAERNYKQVFWCNSNSFLYNMVYKDKMIKDKIECETAITSAAMLGESIFTYNELISIWEQCKRSLLIYRDPVSYGSGHLPFGILTKNEGKKIFYDDCQYHSDVVWPRSTPYLIGLLKLIGQGQLVEEILKNNIDHQMSESAIFYNQELFSRPFGNNPHPSSDTDMNPIPVKNPIQFWSQWCDAFHDIFVRKENDDV